MDKQPYYISPDQMIEGPFFFIAGLYKITKTYSSTKYSVVAITQSSECDDKFIGYVKRIPFFLRRKDIAQWLNPSINPMLSLSNKQKIKTNPFLKIGLWVDQPMAYKDENIVLQSRQQWNLEQDAKNTFGDDLAIDFDQIEKEALEQNEANKLGIAYVKEDDENVDISECDDKELKQDEVTTENEAQTKKKTEKRQFEFNDNYSDEDEPPNKKQKVNANTNANGSEQHDDSLSDCSNSSLSFRMKSLGAARRRSLDLDVVASASKKKTGRKRLSAHN